MVQTIQSAQAIGRGRTSLVKTPSHQKTIRQSRPRRSIARAQQGNESVSVIVNSHQSLLNRGLNEVSDQLLTKDGFNGLQDTLVNRLKTPINIDKPNLDILLNKIQGYFQNVNSTIGKISSGIDSVPIDVNIEQPHFGTKFAQETANLVSDSIGNQSTLQNLLLELQNLISNLKVDIAQFPNDEIASLNSYLITFKSFLKIVEIQLNDGSVSKDLITNPVAASILSFIVITLIALSTPENMTNSQAEKIADDMEVPLEYSPEKIQEYFSVRPVLVTKRSVEVAFEIIRFGSGILQDMAFNQFEQNTRLRARQLREAIERLGSAYVKVLQALSTRVDLFPVEYIEEIELLQDRVPPFPTSVAIEVMESAYGTKIDNVFSELSKEPVAAASLGQVYKGKLKEDGSDVAIKVQRPGVLEQVILDLYIMRKVSFLFRKYSNTNTQWWLLVDEWGSRYLQEMDYTREAANGLRFSQDVAELQGVFAPEVYTNLCSRKILVTAWVEGERLAESQAEDVLTLTNTLLTSYLIQLLETGFMHADPHPGNLIRTPDGRICVLDFGLVTEVTQEQRLHLISYIAHLQLQDWDAITVDLQKLGFIKTDEDVSTTGLVEPLGQIFSELIKGGGAKGVNIDYIIKELNQLAEEYPIFQIPAFFTLILRTFTVIEGIGLSADPKYAIVKECFPYLANRLLTDDSPETQQILKEVLYGKKNNLDINRLRRMMDGLERFSTDALTTTSLTSPESTAIIDPTVKQAIQVVFSKEGSYIQRLFVNEMVVAVDALSREALSEVIRALVVSAPATAALQSLGPLRMVVFPFPTFVEVLSRISPVVELNEEDKEALSTIKGLLDLVGGPENALNSVPNLLQAPEQSVQLAEEIVGMLPQLLPGIAKTGELFIRQLLSRVLTRLSESLMDDADLQDYGLAPSAFLIQLSQPQKQFIVNNLINFMKDDGHQKVDFGSLSNQTKSNF
eukprot:TRINITY_DN2793_c0_g2_i1.p1 TRINITY_DN2793_c0_g2~~TRINITY_DN2793_c0_g2_i1.p1  ORF type:complete len:988 (+),score=151.02 TRINITY_DN2793_c0_g2_i1:77-2965(+)